MKNQAVIEAAKALANEPDSDAAYEALCVAILSMPAEDWPLGEPVTTGVSITVSDVVSSILVEPGFTTNDVRLVVGE